MLIVVLPLIIGRGRLTPADDPSVAVKRAIEEFFDEVDQDTDLVDLTIEQVDGSPAIDMVIAGSGRLPTPEALADKLADVMGEQVRVNVRLIPTEDITVFGNEKGR